MSEQFEVLNPQGETDPIPPRGIAPRLEDLNGKTVGLFATTFKPAAKPILAVVEEKLKAKYPSAQTSWFLYGQGTAVTDGADNDRFQEWARGIDIAVTSVGD
ncbi:MAG: hypothetical protein ABID87_04265 [Chloroflexota bacterium]